MPAKKKTAKKKVTKKVTKKVAKKKTVKKAPICKTCKKPMVKSCTCGEMGTGGK